MAKIVEASGIAGGGDAKKNALRGSSDVEKAMAAAVLECRRKGITDPAEIKKAMLAARERVKAK